MSDGEHPLKKLIEADQARKEAAKQQAEQAKKDAAIAEAAARSRWVEAERMLRDEISAANQLLATASPKYKFVYLPLPQPGGFLSVGKLSLEDAPRAVADGTVQLAKNGTLIISLLVTDETKSATRSFSRTFTVHEVSAADFRQVLTDIYAVRGGEIR